MEEVSYNEISFLGGGFTLDPLTFDQHRGHFNQEEVMDQNHPDEDDNFIDNVFAVIFKLEKSSSTFVYG